MIDNALAALVTYAVDCGLLAEGDRCWATNALLDALERSDYTHPAHIHTAPLETLLAILLDDATARGIIENDVTHRDLLDTKLMGCLTPRPAQVAADFLRLYKSDPRAATDWFYTLNQSCDYIRRYRIQKDVKWVTATPYGQLDITINLSKPEKDPRAIAAAKNAPQGGYPLCQLCRENEGYAGRLNHPARQTLRTIPLRLDGQDWCFQYSPYVYYNEHAIVFNRHHVPMKIEGSTFRRLLDFVRQFPHYFVGSNADLPIVGGSILSHDHFQAGNYTFAMEKAPVELPVTFADFPAIEAGIVRWPLSVLRLRCADAGQLAQLAERILDVWRDYTDESACVFAKTDDQPHNTITPIARMRAGQFELDLVLRNNLTTPEHPLGLYHPHQELHHIKKENIGLIEVMGLAVLPPRLKTELALLTEALVQGEALHGDETLGKHALWAEELLTRHHFTAENALTILQDEVGLVFARVLEHAGVYKCDPAGRQAFLRFTATV